MALATSGAVGADLANMVNEAALRAVRCGRQLVNQEDLMDSVEVIIAGKEKKDRILSAEEKRIVSFHEVGHALATALLKNTQPVQKITIVPRTMGALGYTMQMPDKEEKYLNNRDELLDQITVFLAGRAAEELVFNIQTTGASNDIERATDMARKMVTMFGMSERFGLVGLESIESKYLDGRAVSNCSEETKTAIDTEIVKIMKERYEIAKQLLNENRDALNEIAEFLINKETITGDEFMDIFNKVKDDRQKPDMHTDEGNEDNENN
jgi:cell division protease FtsH